MFFFDAMFRHEKIFFALLNILGLNFSPKVIPNVYIISFHILINVIGAVTIYYEFKWNFSRVNIYFFIAMYQFVLCQMLQNLFVFRSLNKFKLPINFDNCEIRKFYIYTICILIVRAMKIALRGRVRNMLLMAGLIFMELIVTCNDFMFAFYVNSLTNMLKCDNRNVLKCLVFKRMLMKRYSLEILCTNCYNVGLLVMALYWILMRVSFGLLKSYRG